MAEPVKLIGEDVVTQTGRRRGWTKAQGRSFTDTFRGKKETLEDFYESKVDDDSIDGVQFINDSGRVSVEVTTQDESPTGGGESTQVLNEFWEIIPQDMWKNIRAHQTFNKDDEQGNMELARQNFENGKPPLIAGLVANAEIYQKLLLHGQEEYVRTAVILQNTVRLGPRSALSGNWEGVDKALRFDNDPGSPDPPSAIIGTLDDMPEFDDTKKQWLKRAPIVREVQRRRFEIITQWWFARRWSESLYGGDAEDGNP